MKRELFSFAVFLCASGLNAQTFAGSKLTLQSYESQMNIIPSSLSLDGKALLEVTRFGETGKSYEVYNDELERVASFDIPYSFTDGPAAEGISIFDTYSCSIDISQTLFNDDDKFEYLQGIYNLASDGYSYTCSGFRVMSEDGAALSTVSFDKEVPNVGFHLLNMGDNSYLVVSYDMDDPEDVESGKQTFDFYKIIPSASSVKLHRMDTNLQLASSLIRRSEPVVVQLGNTDGQAERKLNVVDAAGRLTFSTNVPAGQKSCTIAPSHLSRGLNVVYVESNGGQKESCKIYVK